MVISQFLWPSLVRCSSVCGSRSVEASTASARFPSGQVADEHRLLAEHGLDRLSRLDRRDVDLRGAFRQDVRRRTHLPHQRPDGGKAAHSRKTYGRDIDEIAPPHTFSGTISRSVDARLISH
jgi:hypothetical protein